jgi:hypothetical protein
VEASDDIVDSELENGEMIPLHSVPRILDASGCIGPRAINTASAPAAISAESVFVNFVIKHYISSRGLKPRMSAL